MAYSLGLTLYNLAGRATQAAALVRPPRPPGPLVWLHTPGPDGVTALTELARHLVEDDGVSTVITTRQTGADLLPNQPAPPDTVADAQAFLDHWHPDLVIFADGELLPALIHDCVQRKIPLLMVNARAPRLSPGREGWYPGLIKSALQAFAQILVVDEAAARAFRRAGAEPGQIVLSGRMEEASAALPYVESDRTALAKAMATRPVWLAADVSPAELPLVIAAHRQALQVAHRLLLILVPQDTSNIADLIAGLERDENWRVSWRQADQEPDAEKEVYVADASEYGLWYRLAPVTFLGGSLDGTGCARSPLEPASLGSAIIFGPRVGSFGPVCGRLAAARAARMVTDGTELAIALDGLLYPDRAARQAHAAWNIATEGTEVTEQAMDLIRKLMDGTF